MEFVVKKLQGINTAPLPGSPCPLPHCAGSPIAMPSPTYPEECEQCVTECDLGENCDLATEEQCTDRCGVIPCDDPCLDICDTSASWSSTLCQGRHQGFDDLLGCHPDLPYPESTCPGHMHVPQDNNHSQHLHWNNASLSRELDALICACSTQSSPHPFNSTSCDPKILSTNKPHSHSHHHPSIPPSIPARISNPGSPMLSSSASSRSSPDPPTAVTAASQPSPPIARPKISPQINAGPHERHPSETVSCLWADCGKSFNSYQDLISHFNAAHIHLPIAQESYGSSHQISSHWQPSSSVYTNAHGNNALPDMNTISCMWSNCNQYPTPSHVPGPSAGNVNDAALGLLANHLLQDHLGVPVPHPSTPNDGGPGKPILSGEPALPAVFRPYPRSASNASTSTSNSGSSHTSPQHATLTSVSENALPAPRCFCKWQSCPGAQTAFTSAADLTAHITDIHVGAGNSRYHCMWEGCNRHGEAGFSSKQKILRHIQSHTGHRPFQCKICDQYFSEAATLQQHMRRHTKEKPYICDFPGCNKAFAITGALTIHRRVHSGSKPFKCTYCDRSFSESSNLSKHIRTHTGDRPYPCLHPGCEKRFARPDQVARHMNVHNKKKKAGRWGDVENTRDLGEVGMDIQDMKIEA